MKYAGATLGAMLVLGGCWGAPPNEKILTQQCTTLFSDPSMVDEIARELEGTTTEAFCACYASKVVTQDNVDVHKDVLNAVNVTLEETGLGVEPAVEKIIADMKAGSGFDTFSEAELMSVGQYLDDLSDNMADAGGTCPA